MATTFTNTLQPSNSTDALFRAWSQFIRDAFTAGGWVQTADTGQINFATVTRPLAVSTKMGYVILRMDDSLQASKPVYLRIDFGSGSAAANSPAVWLEIGTGSNGSGTITGSVWAQASPNQIQVGANSAALTNVFSHSSVATSRAAIAMFVHATASHALHFSIERAKDSSGVDDGDTIWVAWSGAATGHLSHSRSLTRAGGTQPAEQDKISAIVASNNPQTYMENISMGLVIPFGRNADNADVPSSNLMTGYLILPESDFTTDAQLTVYVYSVATIYRRLNVCRVRMQNNNNATAHVIYQRFD